MARLVSLGDDTYSMLSELKGEKSFNDIIREMAERERLRQIRDLAGSWKMTDKEHDEFLSGIRARRKESKTKRVSL